MSFAMPSTPPRSAKKKTPQVSITETTPTTPAKEKPGLDLSDLQTPRKTPHKPKTPYKAQQTKTPKGLAPTELLLPTPGFTPQKSPRNRRKRPSVDLFSSSESLGMLLPNHSVAGSGRKTVSPQKLHAPISLDPRELSKINENLAFEEDDEAVPDSPTRRAPRRKHPKTAVTPGKQMITEDLVEQWHGKSFNTDFSSDDEFDSGGPIPNPFTDASPTKRGPPAPSKVDFSTHNEFINPKTGERKVVELTETQKKFKPKKLSFSGL
ncbi:hypothetical protein FT663_01120 [Candidozyma haemuli var. vulneris]|nr:hypothetical protein FT662_00420 [[Candida] haemuloni var. vulneris]KAF3994764.1 hypothetical protein FT663_01120 [[Candida] haemuloni var. vulneris]